MYGILLFGRDAESSSFKNNFQFFVKSVATVYHANWRQSFLTQNPHAKNRFKLTTAITHYNPSDFQYPMILTVGSCVVHRNLKVARSRFNTSQIYVDILNMNYDELPSDWAYENRATARVACKQILKSLRQKRLFNQNLIEEMSEIIHNEWMKRNQHRSEKHLMVPYANLSSSEKEKDRKVVLVACQLFNEHYFYYRFNTTPIPFIDHIFQ